MRRVFGALLLAIAVTWPAPAAAAPDAELRVDAVGLVEGSIAPFAITYDSNEATDLMDFSGGSDTLSFGAAVPSGRLVVGACIILSNATTFNTPTGSNITFDSPVQIGNGGANIRVMISRGVTTGNLTTVTFSLAASDAGAARCWIASFSSTTGWASPDDGSSSSTASADTAHDADVSITTTGANSVLLCVSTLDDTVASFTVATGYTAFTVDAGIDMFARRIETATGTFGCSNTSSANEESATVLRAFKEDAGGGGGSAPRGQLLLGCCEARKPRVER